MSLAVPSALLLGLVALPIVVLYILKVRLRRIPVSTNMFWKQMFDEKPPRALWRKLRHMISLLAQLLILALLIFAIADPVLKWQSSGARRIVLVMDTSASMQAVDAKPNRFEAARDAALKLLDGVRETDSIAIVSASNRPEVVIGMGSHVPTLKDALAKMQPTDSGAAIDQAVQLAKQLIGDHPHGQVIVMTDGCAQRANKSEKVEQLDATLGSSAAAKAVKPSEDAKNANEPESKPESRSKSEPLTGDGTEGSKDAAKDSQATDLKAKEVKVTDDKTSDGKTIESSMPGTNLDKSNTTERKPTEDKSNQAQPTENPPTVTAPTAGQISDASTADDEKSGEKKSIDVQFVYFGSNKSANVGITQLQARRSLIDALGYQVLVSVLNASDKPIKCRLELELESVPVDVLPLDLQPGQAWTRTLEKTSLEGGVLTASLNRIELVGSPSDSIEVEARKVAAPQGNSNEAPSTRTAIASPAQNQISELNQLVVDDRAWALVPPRVIQRVHIVSPGNLFLQKVFEANQLVKLTLSKELPATWPEDTIVVCHKLVPEKLPEGKLLIIDPDTNCDLMQVGSAIENPIVTKQDDKSPLMTHLRLDNVLIPDARQLIFAENAGIVKLAQTVGGETVLASQSNAKSKRLILAVNLEKSDLAFRTAFPILVSNSLSWFSGGNGQFDPAIEAGGNAKLAANADSVNIEADAKPTTSSTDSAKVGSSTKNLDTDKRRWLVSPNKHAQPLASTMTGPLQQVGLWAVVDGKLTEKSKSPIDDLLQKGELVQNIAVNMASVNETDLRPDSNELSKSAELQASWFTRPVWFYLAAVVCLLSVIEWCLYQRRIIT